MQLVPGRLVTYAAITSGRGRVRETTSYQFDYQKKRDCGVKENLIEEKIWRMSLLYLALCAWKMQIYSESIMVSWREHGQAAIFEVFSGPSASLR